MKVTAVKVHLVHTPIPAERQVESGAGRKLARQMALVEVQTDEGLAGYGSPSGPYDLGVLERALSAVIAPLLVGHDPADIQHHWHRLFHGEIARNLGHRGVGVAALSGVDIALWDLAGKALGVPLHQLLGGRYHTGGVRAYASSIYWDLTPEQAAEQALGWVEQGFGAVKLKVGRLPARDRRNAAAIRAAIGDDRELLVDANQSLDRAGALGLLGALEDLGCYWFEEPLPVDDVAGHALLRRRRRGVRIATGENMYTRWAFAEYVERDAIDVLQADASRAGGISEAQRIQALASAHHLDWSPHTFNDAITVAANLHLVVASPHPAMFEWDVTHNDLMTRLATTPLRPERGEIVPPAGPGLGLELDWDFIRAHPWRGEPAIGAGHGMR